MLSPLRKKQFPPTFRIHTSQLHRPQLAMEASFESVCGSVFWKGDRKFAYGPATRLVWFFEMPFAHLF